MEKQKRWQFYLIVAVLALTLYNILPTVFYYTKPLRSPIDEKRAEYVAQDIVKRVDNLEEDAVKWIYSFSKLLHVKPNKVEIVKENPRLVQVSFYSKEDAARFKRLLPRAGLLIPFVPAQLEIYPGEAPDANTVLVSRQISLHLDQNDISKMFRYIPKLDADGKFSAPYRELVNDRAKELALSFGEARPLTEQMKSLTTSESSSKEDDAVVAVAREIADMEASLTKNPSILKRVFASLGQDYKTNPEELIQKFIARMETASQRLIVTRDKLLSDQKSAKEKGSAWDSAEDQLLASTQSHLQSLAQATSSLKKHSNDIKSAVAPLTLADINKSLAAGESKVTAADPRQVLSLEGRNPFIEALVIDWNSDTIYLKLYSDIEAMRESEVTSEASSYLKEKLNQYVINEIARGARIADEKLVPYNNTFAVSLTQLPDSKSFLALDLGYVAAKQTDLIKEQLNKGFTPNHPDLVRDTYPIRSYADWKKESPEMQRLGFVIYAPAMYPGEPLQGFRHGSIYVIAKGMESIMNKAHENPNAPESQLLFKDLEKLKPLFQDMNFIGYPGASYDLAAQFSNDFIFEQDDYYNNLIKATRENFEVNGSKKQAILPFTDVEQRIITLNKIDDSKQEDLLRWAEEYATAQIDLDPLNHYQVPAPTKSPFLSNLWISAVKYFRGDDRKILKWGLDLAGGKTVRIGLRDHNNQPVTNPEDLKQSVNELYTRINKMGVAERTIRIENQNIVLEFPGSQALSAQDLVKASAMYFHIVNEKFASNPALKIPVNQFLQEVWNEAVVTNRKDIDSINEIAWNHLGGESQLEDSARPLSESAKILYENGLRLSNPREKNASNSFNDSISKIAMMRGDDFTEWNGQTNPLLVIFNNFALEGSSLTNVQIGFDQTEGNNLSFSVKKNYEGGHDITSGSPREDFYTWTSQFAEDKIAGTPKEAYSQGRGYRMAVILNGTVVSSPSLRAALRDNGTISGRFTQREIAQLASDLKAGSLSFTPRILSEQNVSAELGSEERTKGIVAALVALALVIVAMIGYYRFAGLVASCAVLLNVLIMWGVLQNLGAALTLPTIAGIVLTIGMAVDANVLVFERIREEFAISGRISSAIQAGYRKAFSAIVDSNITTIIAALILIQFDSGPIKGFAVSLIVGILSSMFTSLFMTRFFFSGWVQNPENKSLTMMQFIGKTHFNFLKQAKKAIIISAIVALIGTYFLISERKTIFGMDFTGGYAATVELEAKPNHPNYRLETMQALLAHGASPRDVQIRELTKPNQLKIQLGTGMEEKGQPFYQLPEALNEGKYAYEYQKNPRLVWLVQALEGSNLHVADSQLNTLDDNWTVMSGQFSDAMRNNALIALSLALFSILIYITFRFEFKYAIAAVVGLVHDVLITLGILAVFHWLGFLVQIDLQVVGAIMTIIGYSLNDTIIVFDRIREDIRLMRKMPYSDVINHALNVTLSRTLMTSGTTLLVLLALVLLGGQSILAFSLVMTIGVLVGTFSSLFIATPTLLYLHNREEAENVKELTLRKN